MITNLKDYMLLSIAEEINDILKDIEDKEIIKKEINSLFGVYNILSKNGILTPICELKVANVTVNQDNFIEIFFNLQKDIFNSLKVGFDDIFIVTAKNTNRNKIEYIIGQLYGYLTNYIDNTMIKNKEVEIMKNYHIAMEFDTDRVRIND